MATLLDGTRVRTKIVSDHLDPANRKFFIGIFSPLLRSRVADATGTIHHEVPIYQTLDPSQMRSETLYFVSYDARQAVAKIVGPEAVFRACELTPIDPSAHGATA